MESHPHPPVMLWISFIRFLASNASLSLALTIFYKRTFQAEMFTSVTLFILIHFLAQQAKAVDPFLLSATIVVAIFVARKFLYHLSTLASLRLWTFAVNFVAMADLLRGVHYSAMPLALKILIFAVPQFARYPKSLKECLRSIRAIFGPLYVIHSVVYIAYGLSGKCEDENSDLRPQVQDSVLFSTRRRRDGTDLSHVLRKQSISGVSLLEQGKLCRSAAVSRVLCALFSCVAGILLRPDNRVVLETFGVTVQFKWLRLGHRYAMIVSFVFFSCSCLLEICT